MTTAQMSGPVARPALVRIGRAGVVTAIADFFFATGMNVGVYGATFARLWQGVASTLLGRAAFDGGARTTAIGLVMQRAPAPITVRWWVMLIGHIPFVGWPLVRAARLHEVSARRSAVGARFVVPRISTGPWPGIADYQVKEAPILHQGAKRRITAQLELEMQVARRWMAPEPRDRAIRVPEIPVRMRQIDCLVSRSRRVGSGQ